VSPRIAPLPVENWGESEQGALKRAGMAGVPVERLPAAIGALLNHPPLAGPFLAFNMSLLLKGELPARWRELMILRLAWRARSRYVWLEHVHHAALNDISMDDVEALAGDDLPLGFGPVESALLRATDELLDHHVISDETWSVLAEQLDRHQLMEVPFVVGTYSCITMAFKSYGLELDASLLDLVASGVPMPEEG
jgi:4-carboxymuconolactone decarboxylase